MAKILPISEPHSNAVSEAQGQFSVNRGPAKKHIRSHAMTSGLGFVLGLHIILGVVCFAMLGFFFLFIEAGDWGLFVCGGAAACVLGVATSGLSAYYITRGGVVCSLLLALPVLVVGVIVLLQSRGLPCIVWCAFGGLMFFASHMGGHAGAAYGKQRQHKATAAQAVPDARCAPPDLSSVVADKTPCNMTFRNVSDAAAGKSCEPLPRARRVAAAAARWTARALSIPIAAWAISGIAGFVLEFVTRRTGAPFPHAGHFVFYLSLALGSLIAWRSEGEGGVLLFGGASVGVGAALSCNDPFFGYETMLGCTIMAPLVLPAVLFLVSHGLRATLPLPASVQTIDRSSGRPDRWRWIARATSLVALTYAMWFLAMTNLHRGSYENARPFLAGFLCLAILGCITGWNRPGMGGALLLLAVVGLCVTLSRSDLQRWNGDRILNFAALAVPLAVAGLFQLAGAAQRPRTDGAETDSQVSATTNKGVL